MKSILVLLVTLGLGLSGFLWRASTILESGLTDVRKEVSEVKIQIAVLASSAGKNEEMIRELRSANNTYRPPNKQRYWKGP